MFIRLWCNVKDNGVALLQHARPTKPYIYTLDQGKTPSPLLNCISNSKLLLTGP